MEWGINSALHYRKKRLKIMTHRYPYQNSSLPVEERAADLLSRMTLAEKIAQLGSIWIFEVLEDMKFSPIKAKKLFSQGLGQVTRIGGASSLDPAAGAELANTIQKYLLENTRLGIPAMIHEECCSGYMARDATCFPQIIGVASTWEPELVEAMAAVVRTQMRAAGAHQGLSPVLDVTRDPRWGRVEETFGEDPYLVAQGLCTGFRQTGEGIKHGQTLCGLRYVGRRMNGAPHLRLVNCAIFALEAAVKSGLASVMNAYNELDGALWRLKGTADPHSARSGFDGLSFRLFCRKPVDGLSPDCHQQS
jgi:beta-glucosidase